MLFVNLDEKESAIQKLPEKTGMFYVHKTAKRRRMGIFPDLKKAAIPNISLNCVMFSYYYYD